MKIPIITITNSQAGTIDLPVQFQEQVRPDVIKRAVEALQANARQPYGAKPGAGMRHSAKLSRRRRDYKTSYGHGISRVPRKILSRSGTHFNWVGANAPGTVGGRQAHPPKAQKDLSKKINKKENRKAIRSAMAAVMIKDVVQQRGHALPQNYPFALDTAFETLLTAGQAKKVFNAIGLTNDLERVSKKTIRAGRGTMRGRKYKQAHGPLIVVSQICQLTQAARNLPGVDVVAVDSLNANLLAPGAVHGRLTLFTAAALTRLTKEQLFTNNYHNHQERSTETTPVSTQQESTKPKK